MVLLCLMSLPMFSCSGQTSRTSDTGPESGSSMVSAIPIGMTASAIVELSDMYRAPETYDAKITVLEVVRGEESTDLIKKASESNAPAPNGFEYLLARIRFEFFARGTPGNKTWSLSGKQFHAFSGDGTRYGTLSIVLPEPELAGELRSDDSCQGWLAFEVAKQDKKPLMTFEQGNVWFQLF